MGNSLLLMHIITEIYIAEYICYYNKINITMLISHKVQSIKCSLFINVHFKMQNFIHLVQNIIHQVQNIMPAGLQQSNTTGNYNTWVVAGFDITMQRLRGINLMGRSESCMSIRVHLPLCPIQ